MQKEQRQALDLVLTLCECDDKFIESTELYGNWFEHMIDQLADLDEGRASNAEGVAFSERLGKAK